MSKGSVIIAQPAFSFILAVASGFFPYPADKSQYLNYVVISNVDSVLNFGLKLRRLASALRNELACQEVYLSCLWSIRNGYFLGVGSKLFGTPSPTQSEVSYSSS